MFSQQVLVEKHISNIMYKNRAQLARMFIPNNPHGHERALKEEENV